MQLEASMHQGLEQQMPSFNLPSKILCKVINIQRRVGWIPLYMIEFPYFFFTKCVD